MDTITINSKYLLEKMRLGCKYTYRELLKLCDFTETQLCYAILTLVRDGKMNRYREHEVMYELV